MSKPLTNRFSHEVRCRASGCFSIHQAEHPSQWAAINLIAGQDRLHGRDAAELGPAGRAGQGPRGGPTTEDSVKIKALERENRELRQADEIMRKASVYFAQAELAPLRWHSTCFAGRTLASSAH